VRYIRQRFRRNPCRCGHYRRRRWNPFRIRTASRDDDDPRSLTQYCEAILDGGGKCGLNTREGKLYCPAHVEKHSYIVDLLNRIAETDKEIERVRRQGFRGVSESSIVVKDILTKLRAEGPRTVERLARAFKIEPRLIKEYGKYMINKKMIVSFTSARGSAVYRIPSSDLRRYRQRRRRRLRRNPWQVRSWRHRRRHTRRRNPWTRDLSAWTARFATEREEGPAPYPPLSPIAPVGQMAPRVVDPAPQKIRRKRTGPSHYEKKRRERFKRAGIYPEDIKYANCLYRDSVEYGEDRCKLCDAKLAERYLLWFSIPDTEEERKRRYFARSFFPVGNECLSNWTDDLEDSEDKRVYLETAEEQLNKSRRARRERAQAEEAALAREEAGIVEEEEPGPPDILSLIDDDSTDDDW